MALTRKNVKTGIQLAVGWCAGTVIGHVIGHNVAPKNRRQKAEILVGAYVIGAMVGAQAEKYIGQQIDYIADAIDEAKNQN